MSRSKMAEVPEWTEVGEEGMEAGERVISREFLFGEPREGEREAVC